MYFHLGADVIAKLHVLRAEQKEAAVLEDEPVRSLHIDADAGRLDDARVGHVGRFARKAGRLLLGDARNGSRAARGFISRDGGLAGRKGQSRQTQNTDVDVTHSGYEEK